MKWTKILSGTAILIAFPTTLLIALRRLREYYLAQRVDENAVNLVAIMDSLEKGVASRAFKGGYIRAIMGSVGLDLREASVESKPVTIEITVILGSAEIKISSRWKVELDVGEALGSIYHVRMQEKFPENTPPDLIISGKVIQGILAITQ